jgi:hypothetical protein
MRFILPYFLADESHETQIQGTKCDLIPSFRPLNLDERMSYLE